MTQRKLYRRIIAWVALVATLLVVLFSTIYPAEHLHHECKGEGCHVCAVMAECADNLKTLSAAVIFIAAVGFLLEVCTASLFSNTAIYVNNSLISRKVRLNN